MANMFKYYKEENPYLTFKPRNRSSVSSSGCSSSISSEEEITSITTNLQSKNHNSSSIVATKNADYIVLHASQNIHSPIVLHESPMVQSDTPSPPPIRNESQINKAGQHKDSISLSPNANKQQFRVVALFGQNFKTQNNIKCENLNLINSAKCNPQTSSNISSSSSSSSSPTAANLLVNGVILNHTSSLQRTIRPNRPPDYETTLKRIGLMRSERPTTTHLLPQLRPNSLSVNVDVNDSSVSNQFVEQQHSPPFPPPPPPHLLIDSTLQLPSPNQSVSSDSSDSTDSNPNPNQNSPFCKASRFADKKKNGRVKKSVSFSDHVILVACAEEEHEEYIPNPIMERVLGKAFFNNIQQSCK